jgi:hypothetical protein
MQFRSVFRCPLARRVEHRFYQAHCSSVRSLAYDMPHTVPTTPTAAVTTKWNTPSETVELPNYSAAWLQSPVSPRKWS